MRGAFTLKDSPTNSEISLTGAAVVVNESETGARRREVLVVFAVILSISLDRKSVV